MKHYIERKEKKESVREREREREKSLIKSDRNRDARLMEKPCPFLGDY